LRGLFRLLQRTSFFLIVLSQRYTSLLTEKSPTSLQMVVCAAAVFVMFQI
jgi:hypothetical protein